MKKTNFLGQVFTVVALVLYTGGPLTVILSGGASQGERELPHDFELIRQLFLLVYAFTLLLLVPHWKKALYLLFKEKTILLMVGIALASVFWSSAPQETVFRSVAMIGTTLFGIYFATCYGLKQQLDLLGWAFGLIIALSFVFAIALPQYGIMGGVHAGAWRGIYTHKNTLGPVMVLSALVFFLLAIKPGRRSWLCWGGFSLSLLLLLLSKSTSPLVNLVVLSTAFPVFCILRWSYTLKAFALSCVAVVGFCLLTLGALGLEELVGLFGKDLTLTGRTELWKYVWEMIQQRPWLGYGYASLWKDWNSETAYVWHAVGWTAPGAHNGFLELWLELGLLGMLVFLLQFLAFWPRVLMLISQSKTSEYFLPLLLMLFTIIMNLTENTILQHNSVYWVLYSSTVLSSTRKPRIETEAVAVPSSSLLPAYRAEQVN